MSASSSQRSGPQLRKRVHASDESEPSTSRGGRPARGKCGAPSTDDEVLPAVPKSNETTVPPKVSVLRMWCLECEALTTDERCFAEHSFCSAERVVQEAVRDIRVMQEAFAAGMRGAEKNMQIMRDCADAAAARGDPAPLRQYGARTERIWDALQPALKILAEEARQCQEMEGRAAEQALRGGKEGWKAAHQVPRRLPELVVVKPAPLKEKDLGVTVADLSGRDPREWKDERAAALAALRRKGVRRIDGLVCKRNSAWVLEALRCAAPTLEELELVFPRPVHVRAAHTIPGLRRLQLCLLMGHPEPEEEPTLPLPGLSRPGSLQWLRVENAYGPLVWPLLASLLKAHRTTLNVLWLHVQPEEDEDDDDDDDWPPGCSGLADLLGQCSLRLSRIVLDRAGAVHPRALCAAQKNAVGRVLPNAVVECTCCDEVERDNF